MPKSFSVTASVRIRSNQRSGQDQRIEKWKNTADEDGLGNDDNDEEDKRQTKLEGERGPQR